MDQRGKLQAQEYNQNSTSIRFKEGALGAESHHSAEKR